MSLWPPSPAATSSAPPHSTVSSPHLSSGPTEATADSSLRAAAPAAAFFLTPAAAAAPAGTQPAASQEPGSAAAASVPAAGKPAAAAAAAATAAPALCAGSSAPVAEESPPASAAAGATCPTPAAAAARAEENTAFSSSHSRELLDADTGCGVRHHSSGPSPADAGTATVGASATCAAAGAGGAAGCCYAFPHCGQCRSPYGATSCSHTGKAAGVAAARTLRSSKPRRSRNRDVAGMPFWEYVFLRRVGLRDRVQSTWFRQVFAAYASAQAESRRLLAANASAVAIAAASTAAAAGATDIAAAAVATARERGSPHSSTLGSGVAAASASVATAAAPPAARAAVAAVKQNAAAAAVHDGAARQAPLSALFPAAGDAAGPNSSPVAAAMPKKQEAATRTPVTAAALTAGTAPPGGLNSSSFSASSIARHFRRVGALRASGSGSNIVQAGLARSNSSLNSSSRVMAGSKSGEKSRDAAGTTVAGSREALQLQFLLQHEVQQQLQQQQMQQLRLLTSSSVSTLYGVLASSGSSSGSQEGSGITGAAGAPAAGMPFFPALMGGGGAGEIGDFAAAAAAALQQQHENSLAVQLLQQQVEQLQKQVDEKTGESGVLRRLVAEREEELKEKEKEIADSKKACFLLQSERKHLSKALRAAQQEGMERALENERYLRELLRHKEAEAVRLNEVQQLYVSLMHQQQQQPTTLLQREEEEEDDDEEREQQEADELQQQDDKEQKQRSVQQGEQTSLESSGGSAHGLVTEVATVVRGGSGSDGSGGDGRLILEELHQQVAADVEETTAATAPQGCRTSVENAATCRTAENETPATAAAEALQSAAREKQQQGIAGSHVTSAVDTCEPQPAAAGPLPKSQHDRMQWLVVAADDRVQRKQDLTCGAGGGEGLVAPPEAAEATSEAAPAAASALPPRGRAARGPSFLLRGTPPAAGAALVAGERVDAADARHSTSGNSSTTVPGTSVCDGAVATSGVPCISTAATAASSLATPTALSSTGVASADGQPLFGKASTAASSRAASHKSGAEAGGTAEISGKSSRSRPSVVNPLLQLLSLSPSWARGAGRTVLRGSPGLRPAVAITGSSSSSFRGETGAVSEASAAAAQTAPVGPRAGAAAWGGVPAARRRVSSSEAARLAAFETAAADEDEEWGVVGYPSHSRHSSTERRPLQQPDALTNREPRDSSSRKGSVTSDTVAGGSVASGGSSVAAVPAAQGPSPGAGAISASLPAGPIAPTFAAHAASSGVGPPAAATGLQEKSVGAAAIERRTEGCVSPTESSVSKSLREGSRTPTSAPSAAASRLSLYTSGDRGGADLLGAAAAAASSEVAGGTAVPGSSDINAANTQSVSPTGAAAATVLPLTTVSSPAAATAPCSKADAAPGGATTGGSALLSSLPADLATLLQAAAAAGTAAAPSPTVTRPAGEAAARTSAGTPAPAAAAAALVAALARPTAEWSVAGCFREGITVTDDGETKAAAGSGGYAAGRAGAFASSSPSQVTSQPPVRVRQRLLAHQGPVHACCAVPRLWSSQLLNVCSNPSSSSSVRPQYYSRSSSFSRGGHRQRASADLWGGQRGGAAADDEEDEKREETAQAAAAAAPAGRSEEEHRRSGVSCGAAAYGHSSDFVLTCGQDGFLALVDATRGYLAYSFLVSPFRSPLLCVDAAADRPLAVVAAADVSLYTVNTLNQRVVASLKGHSGRITACGFLRAAAADMPALPPSPSSSSSVMSSGSSSVRGSSNGAGAAATADDHVQHVGKRGEGTSRWVAPAGNSGTAAAAAGDPLHSSADLQAIHQRNSPHHCSSSLPGAGSSYTADGPSAVRRGNTTSAAAGVVVADKTSGLPSSPSSSSSSFSVSSSSSSVAASGGGSRRAVPRALERLVSRALRGAGGGGSATLWSAGLDRTVRFWDVERSACVKTTKLPSAVTYAAASPCGEWLATAHQSGAVSLINARSELGEMVTTLQLHEGEPAVGLAFHPSGQWLVSVGKDKQVKVVDVRDCREVYALLHIEMRYNVVQAAPTFSPDGNYVVAAAGPHVFCWSLEEERLRARTRLLQQRAAGAESAATNTLDGLEGDANGGRGMQQQQQWLRGKHAHYQGSAAKRQQVLQFSRDWAHSTRVEALQQLRSSSGRTATHDYFAEAEECQPSVCMHSQTCEIMCLDWRLQHLVTGNRDGSICFWE